MKCSTTIPYTRTSFFVCIIICMLYWHSSILHPSFHATHLILYLLHLKIYLYFFSFGLDCVVLLGPWH